MTIAWARTRATDIFQAARRESGEIADEARSATGHVQVAVMGAIERVPDLMGTARGGASQVAEHMPEAVESARVAAHETETRLQTLPDPTLRLLAAGSIGMAAGLYIAGAPRLYTLAALASAFVAGSAIATRPDRISLSPR
jgi:hypothetical protein